MNEKEPVLPYKETWENFGRNIETFLEKHGQELKGIDLIAGFTRGGMLLATTLSTLLRDTFGDVARKNSGFASLRPIPSGITSKTYSHPCFVMDSPISPDEVADYRQFTRDIRCFKEKFCKNKKILSVLLVDDNLTGATRLFAYKKALEKLRFVEVKTLAYTRLESFEYPTLDYMVREFPSHDTYFIMPYHKDHGTFELPALRVRPIYLVLKKPSNFESLQRELRKVEGRFDVTRHRKGRCIVVGRGASVIHISKQENRIVLNFLYEKYYPPKRCLRLVNQITNLNTFEEVSSHLWSLCGLGAQKADMVCFYCSSLNCNFEILKTVLLHCNPGVNFEVVQMPETREDSILSLATRNWLAHFKNALSKNELVSGIA